MDTPFIYFTANGTQHLLNVNAIQSAALEKTTNDEEVLHIYFGSERLTIDKADAAKLFRRLVIATDPVGRPIPEPEPLPDIATITPEQEADAHRQFAELKTFLAQIPPVK